MVAPTNLFKRKLKTGEKQIGLWLGLANSYTAELLGGSGFDWLLVDGEHGPNDIRSILAQLQALQSSQSSVIVRVPVGTTHIIKQVLDVGAQTLLVPMVTTAEEARERVLDVRYPPAGRRGVGASLARASAFSRTVDYLKTADDEICLLVQVETLEALQHIEEIAAVDGVDGIFVGPADLAADMGFRGQPGAVQVQDAVEDALLRITKCKKAAGILSSDEKLCHRYLDLGATFVAVGSDVGLLANASTQLIRRFRS